jgi:peptidoglycan/LPS O-acetylase OafA/YrhL
MNERSPQKPALKYRPEIDGLRAVAVLAVLVFHAKVSRLAPGGYAGVDVFFVISGYLISAIIFSDISAGRFSVVGFYERRIRRIIPALFCMLIVYSVVAAFLFLPPDLVEFSRSLLAAATSTSNFYFWRHSGYFNSPESSPLVHTWSLAVEEQFYIFFPLLLVAVRRFFPKRLKTAVIALWIASLAASAAILPYSQDTAFYMPYTRAWELLLGTILSLGIFPRLDSALLRNLAAFSGAGMIAYSFFFYNRLTPFPGLHALTPCIGTALILGAGESGSSIVGSVLSWRPIVFVGLISYSLYLWHWPVILLQGMGVLFSMGSTLPRQYAGLLPQNVYNAAVDIAVSFALAILSWRFVERPFRTGSLRLSGRPLFAIAGTLMALLIGFSSWTILAAGFPGRFSAQAEQVAYPLDHWSVLTTAIRTGSCFISSGEPLAEYDKSVCLRQVDGKRNYLLLGDSHAAALWPGLATALPEDNIMQATVSGCRPFAHPLGPESCRKMMDFIFQSYLPAHPVQGLLLQDRWSPDDIGGIADTVEWASQHRVPLILIGPVQDYDAPLPRLLAYAITWKQPELPARHLLSQAGLLDARLEGLAANSWHVPYISLYKEICSDGVCAEYADAEHTVPLMFDADHLSPPGALLVVRRLKERGKLF